MICQIIFNDLDHKSAWSESKKSRCFFDVDQKSYKIFLIWTKKENIFFWSGPKIEDIFLIWIKNLCFFFWSGSKNRDIFLVTSVSLFPEVLIRATREIKTPTSTRMLHLFSEESECLLRQGTKTTTGIIWLQAGPKWQLGIHPWTASRSRSDGYTHSELHQDDGSRS